MTEAPARRDILWRRHGDDQRVVKLDNQLPVRREHQDLWMNQRVGVVVVIGFRHGHIECAGTPGVAHFV